MAKVALNTMVAAETLEAIRGMATGKSQGQVIDELVVAAQGGDKHSEVGRWFRETWTRLEGLPDADGVADIVRAVIGEFRTQRATSSQVPSTLSSAPAAVQQSPSAGYDAGCGHCGNPFKVAAGRPPTTLCPGCFRIGHRNTPNCYECGKAEHLAKLRAQDKTGGDREEIDHGFDFG